MPFDFPIMAWPGKVEWYTFLFHQGLSRCRVVEDGVSTLVYGPALRARGGVPPANIVGCLAHETQALTTETCLVISFAHSVSERHFTTAIKKRRSQACAPASIEDDRYQTSSSLRRRDKIRKSAKRGNVKEMLSGLTTWTKQCYMIFTHTKSN